MKWYIFLILIGFIASMPSCKNQSETSPHVHKAGEQVYMCPMDCEKGKHYDNPGKCPVCGMNLELTAMPDAASPKLTYKINLAPVSLKAATLSFRPNIVGDEKTEVALDVEHEKKIHLIVVNEDLSYFDHIHPEYQADGSYKIEVIPAAQKFKIGPGHDETKFVHGGKYTLFADYMPTGGTHQVEKIVVDVAGKAQTPSKLSGNRWIGSSGDYKVTLTSASTALKAGSSVQFSGVVTDKTGREVDIAAIENYLGAKAHMVVVSTTDKEYLHVHPEVVGGKFDLNTTFAKADIYKGWIQFQIKGKVYAVDFIFDVK
jgi:hypothetical protein